MSTITRSLNPKQLQDGLNAIVGKNYARFADQHKTLFDIVKSQKAYEEDVLISGLPPGVVKAEGSSITYYGTLRESYVARYTHETVGLGYIVTQEAVEDNLYQRDLGKGSAFMGYSMGHTKQVRAADILNRGFAGGPTYGDGQVLFSNAHPINGPAFVAAGVSNLLAASALTEATLEAALTQIEQAVDDQGLPVKLSAVSIHVAPANRFNVQRILNSPLRSSTPNNDINVINDNGAMPWYVNNFFTSNTAWFIKTDAMDGLKCFERRPLTTKVFIDDDTGNIKVSATERYSFGVTDWRGIYGSAGA